MSTYLLILITIFVVANMVSAIAWVVNVIVGLRRYKKETIGWRMHLNSISVQEQTQTVLNAVSLDDRVALEKLTFENKRLKEQRDRKHLTKEPNE